jgi:hypothetical protein
LQNYITFQRDFEINQMVRDHYLKQRQEKLVPIIQLLISVEDQAADLEEQWGRAQSMRKM